MKNWKLYIILDKELAEGKDLKKLAIETIKGGANVIQLRDKTSPDRIFIKDAEVLRSVTRQLGVQFIINDRVDIAEAIDADGVHLGQDDFPIDIARSILGESKLVGISCHSLKQAIDAQRNGADYIGFGPIFKTSTKPNLDAIGLRSIKAVKKRLKIPIVCIGGINALNIKGLLRAGAGGVAVSSAIIKSNNPRQSALEIKRILEGYEK